MNKKPLVSVIIPTYNRANCIKRSIESVLQQTYENLEVIVVDDASTDETEQVVGGIQDSRVMYYSLKKNSGANAARNKGIEIASGELLAFQDSDDEWYPQKLEMQVKSMMESTDDIGLVYCAMEVIEKNFPYRVPDPNYTLCDLEENIVYTLARGNIISTQTILIRKECFKKIGMFDEKMPRWQDYEFVLRVISKYKVRFVDDVLVTQYLSEDSISKNTDALCKAIEYLIEKYFSYFNEKELHHIFMRTCIRSLIMCGVKEKKFWQLVETTSGDMDIFSEILSNLYVSASELNENKRSHINYLEERIAVEWQLQRKLILTKIQNKESYMIYGAGKLAKKTLNYLCKNGQSHMPCAFLVSHREDSSSHMEGLEVMAVDDVPDNMHQMMVLVCVDEKHYIDIGNKLMECGFTNIYYVGNNPW